MRTYHVATVSIAVGASERWIDNLLSRAEIPGVDAAGRGIARRISQVGLVHIALIRRLSSILDVPVERAARLARELLTNRGGSLTVSDGVELRVDISALELEVERRMADLALAIQPRRRGRPPKGSK